MTCLVSHHSFCITLCECDWEDQVVVWSPDGFAIHYRVYICSLDRYCCVVTLAICQYMMANDVCCKHVFAAGMLIMLCHGCRSPCGISWWHNVMWLKFVMKLWRCTLRKILRMHFKIVRSKWVFNLVIGSHGLFVTKWLLVCYSVIDVVALCLVCQKTFAQVNLVNHHPGQNVEARLDLAAEVIAVWVG